MADDKNAESPIDKTAETSQDNLDDNPGQAQAGKQQTAEPHDLGEPTLESQLEAAQVEIAELKDQLIRDQAETQNIRKRVQKDVENARKFALEKFVAELLPVVDNLERALQSASDHEEARPILEGVELTYKSLLDTLKKFNVEQLNPVGEPFDPQMHEAMTMVPNPEMEPNSVMDVMQKGYTLNGRLVRAAMVVVSK